MRRTPLALAAVALALLTGCFECEEIFTALTWTPEAERFEIERAYRNVNLECGDVAECTEAAKAVISRSEGSPFEDPAETLGEGATLESLSLARRGDALDVVVRYSMAEVSDAASRAHVYVEQEERALRTREHLILMPLLSEGVQLVEPSRARSRSFSVIEEGSETTEWTVWSLPTRARTLSYVEPQEQGIEPMLTRVPGLAEALVAEGLLEE